MLHQQGYVTADNISEAIITVRWLYSCYRPDPSPKGYIPDHYCLYSVHVRSVFLFVTETVRSIWDGEPWMFTWTFTQFVRSFFHVHMQPPSKDCNKHTEDGTSAPPPPPPPPVTHTHGPNNYIGPCTPVSCQSSGAV